VHEGSVEEQTYFYFILRSRTKRFFSVFSLKNWHSFCLVVCVCLFVCLFVFFCGAHIFLFFLVGFEAKFEGFLRAREKQWLQDPLQSDVDSLAFLLLSFPIPPTTTTR